MSSTKPVAATAEIRRRLHRARPYRIVKGRPEQADDGGVDAAHGGLRRLERAQRMPERQSAHQRQQAGQEDGEERDDRAGDARRRGAGHRAEIRGDGEQGPRQRLGRAISGEKGVVGHPTRRHDRVAQQRQHHMAPAEHQRAGAIEGGKQRQQTAPHGNERQGQQRQERRETGDAEAPRDR